jgi:acetyl-CoA C-acetyltransferase
MGCATSTGEQGSNIAKGAIIDACWHKSVPDFQLDRFCTSDLKAVNTPAAKVASGMENLIIASGVESMSCVPIGSNGGPFYWTPNTLLTTSALLKA